MRTHKIALTLLTTSFCGWSLAACQDSGTSPDLGKTADLTRPADLEPAVPKGVYTQTNDSTNNQLYIWSRAADGTLTARTPVDTAGRGIGASLGSQGSVIFDSRSNLFFVVNGGDGSIAMLSLKTDGSVILLDKQHAGTNTVSVTYSAGYVYALNAGDNFEAASITGFQVTGGASLTAMPTWTKQLTKGIGPGQIQFTTDGTTLVVTEKNTNKIDTFPVTSGAAGNLVQLNSNGMTPFGFAFSANQKLIVSEANGGTASQGSASSYSIATGGTLTSITNKLTDNQTSPCWVSIANNVAYLTNATSNNISAYRIGTDGTLTLLSQGISGSTGMHPTDEAITDDNAFLYTLNTTDHTLSSFAINTTDGSLTAKTTTQSVPTNAVGLVAR